MTGLTLKQLRRAIKIIKTAKRFQKTSEDRVRELDEAVDFLTSESVLMPDRDPREVLNEIGFKFTT